MFCKSFIDKLAKLGMFFWHAKEFHRVLIPCFMLLITALGRSWPHPLYFHLEMAQTLSGFPINYDDSLAPYVF